MKTTTTSSSYAGLVNGKSMGNFVGRSAGVIGRIKQIEDGHLILETADGVEVKCFLEEGKKNPSCKYLHFVGEVRPDLSLKQSFHSPSHFLLPHERLESQITEEVTYLTTHPLLQHFFERFDGQVTDTEAAIKGEAY